MLVVSFDEKLREGATLEGWILGLPAVRIIRSCNPRVRTRITESWTRTVLKGPEAAKHNRYSTKIKYSNHVAVFTLRYISHYKEK